MTKKTYYGVFQNYFNDCTCKVWQQTRQYDKKPQGEAISHFSYDFSVDWFDTKEEADQYADECAAVYRLINTAKTLQWETLMRYIDWEALGRDLGFDGFTETNPS